jgi:lysophospholipase L1-like esterase
MIGGISQRNDVDSIREVIHQVRAKQQPEILLMTPAFGFEESDFIKEWTYSIKPDGTGYRARLQRLAADEKCEFVDMTGPWWQYVLDSGKTYGWFRGDDVHANERGTQILARILEKYFAP